MSKMPTESGSFPMTFTHLLFLLELLVLFPLKQKTRPSSFFTRHTKFLGQNKEIIRMCGSAGREVRCRHKFC